MNKKIAFFDVCSREIDNNLALSFRPRVKPIAEKLNRIYDFINKKGSILVFTTCCSGKMLEPGLREDILIIGLDENNLEWKKKIKDYKSINLQKNKFSYEPFNYNKNSIQLIKALPVDEWVIFGNGLDLCVNHIVENILNEGFKVTFLKDVMISSAVGYETNFGKSGTEENKAATFENWCKNGAVVKSLDEFFSTYSL